jgi:hypothetical protein
MLPGTQSPLDASAKLDYWEAPVRLGAPPRNGGARQTAAYARARYAASCEALAAERHRAQSAGLRPDDVLSYLDAQLYALARLHDAVRAEQAAGVKNLPESWYPTELVEQKAAAIRARVGELRRAEVEARRLAAQRKVATMTTQEYSRMGPDKRAQFERELGFEIERELPRDFVLSPDRAVAESNTADEAIARVSE